MRVLIFVLVSLVFAILLFLLLGIATKPDITKDKDISKLVEIDYERSLLSDVSCEKADDKIAQMISESKVCSDDSECTVQGFGCPFGCQTAVRKSAVATIWEEIKSRENSNCVACRYRCYSPNKLYSPTCHNNRCELKVLAHPSSLNKSLQ